MLPGAQVITLPPVRAVAVHALRYALLTNLVPMGLFYSAFVSAGLRAALGAALAWSYLLIGQRLCRGRRVEATLLLGAAVLTVRTVVSWVTGSAFVYFLQPTLSTLLTAGALIGSAMIGRPFLERAARDYVPLPESLYSHPRIARYFTRLSLMWGCAYLVNGSATLWLLWHAKVEDFAWMSKTGGLVLTGLCIAVSVLWFTRTVRGEQIRVRWGQPVPPAGLPLSRSAGR